MKNSVSRTSRKLKKSRCEAVAKGIDIGSSDREITVTSLCREVDMSRQNYYKEKKTRQRREVDEELIIELVKAERRKHKKMGGRKLLDKLKCELQKAGVQVGRDRFFEILRKYGLLVEKRRSSCPRTTNSRHRFRTYENLFEDFKPDGAHQAWVCDLTYIRTEEGFMYMSSCYGLLFA